MSWHTSIHFALQVFRLATIRRSPARLKNIPVRPEFNRITPQQLRDVGCHCIGSNAVMYYVVHDTARNAKLARELSLRFSEASQQVNDIGSVHMLFVKK